MQRQQKLSVSEGSNNSADTRSCFQPCKLALTALSPVAAALLPLLSFISLAESPAAAPPFPHPPPSSVLNVRAASSRAGRCCGFCFCFPTFSPSPVPDAVSGYSGEG